MGLPTSTVPVREEGLNFVRPLLGSRRASLSTRPGRTAWGGNAFPLRLRKKSRPDSSSQPARNWCPPPAAFAIGRFANGANSSTAKNSTARVRKNVRERHHQRLPLFGHGQRLQC